MKTIRYLHPCLVLLLIVLTLIACDRRSKQQAERSGTPLPGPDAKVYAIPAGVSVASVAPKKAGGPADGGALFAKNCVACHQMNGQGVPAVFPPLDGSPYVTGDKTDRLASILLYGLAGPIHVNGTLYNSAMTPFGALMTDEELAAVASHIRSSWSNKAAAVPASVFADARKKWGSRGPFNIAELGEEN